MNDSIFALLLVAIASSLLGLLAPEQGDRSPLRILIGLILSIVLLSPIRPLISFLTDLQPSTETDDSIEYDEYLARATEGHIDLLRSRLTDKMQKELDLHLQDLKLVAEKNEQGEIVFQECIMVTETEPEQQAKAAAERYLEEILECKIIWRVSS